MISYMKCAFCNWKTPRFYTKNGKRIRGNGRLTRHVETEHPDKFAEIMKHSGGEFPDYGSEGEGL